MKRLLILLVRIHFRLKFFRYILWSVLILIVIFVTSIIFVSNFSRKTSAVGWDKRFILTPGNLKIKNFHVAYKGNLIAVVYEAQFKGKNNIYVSLSLNSGKHFIDPILITSGNLTDKLDSNMSPNIAVSSIGELFIAWHDYNDVDSRYHIYYSFSRDMGANWIKPVKMEFKTEMEFVPHVYYDDRNYLHMFFHGFNNSSFYLYHTHTSDNKMFEIPEALFKLSPEMRGAFFPAISIQGSYMFMVWQGKEYAKGNLSDDLFFIRSSNYGESWSSPQRITSSTSNDASPYLLIHNQNIYCVYLNNEKQNWEINLIKGIEFGESWDSEPIKISDTNANCYFPSVMTGDNKDLYFFWYDDRDGKNKIYMRKYDIDNNKLYGVKQVSDNKSDASKPEIISLSNKLLCLWMQNKTISGKYSDIYVKPPYVFSKTHQENKWSKLTTAVIKWRPPSDESGIAGYASIINKFPNFNPTVQNLQGNVRQTVVPFLEDGISYFHIRAIDGEGNYSRTIHYRLNVSNNPLSIPLIKSVTHPEAKSSNKRDAEFNWSIEEEERLKGFLYSFSKNIPATPRKFISDRRISFPDLEDGRYYLSVRAVDKTNTLGRIARYEVLVGQAGQVDPSVYSIIANQDKVKEIKKVPRKRFFAFRPQIFIKLPVELGADWTSDKMNANFKDLQKVNRKYKVDGYSVVLGKQRLVPKEKINSLNGEYSFKDLHNGRYILGVRARYSYNKNGDIIHSWTDPVYRGFNVLIPETIGSELDINKFIFKRLYTNWNYIFSSLFIGGLLVFFIGLGSKTIFYLKLIRYKVIIKIKLVISTFISL